MISFASDTIKANIILEIEIQCRKFYLLRKPEACSTLVNPFYTHPFQNPVDIHNAPNDPFYSQQSM